MSARGVLTSLPPHRCCRTARLQCAARAHPPQSAVELRALQPADQLRLARLLAAGQAHPNHAWWTAFLGSLEESFRSHNASDLVMLLTSLTQMGGRPPQAWLAAHEAAVLEADALSADTLSPRGWLLLLNAYAAVMYRPSEAFDSWFETYLHVVLPDLHADGLASLVASAARLQLPCGAQLEEAIVARLEAVRLQPCLRLACMFWLQCDACCMSALQLSCSFSCSNAHAVRARSCLHWQLHGPRMPCAAMLSQATASALA